jgi:cytochrome c-type biogenesis protein CcmH
MAFILVAGAVSIACIVIITAAVLRKADTEQAEAAYDQKVYRDQLHEIDRDIARGILTQDEATRTRTEIARRILATDQALQTQTGTNQRTNQRTGPYTAFIMAGLLGLICAGAAGIYMQIGKPGYPDLPLQNRIATIENIRAMRPDQADAETQVSFRQGVPDDPEYAALVEQLRLALTDRPGDIQGLRLLANGQRRLGNYAAAHDAQGRLVAALGDQANANDFVDYAELMIFAAGGYVSPQAERAIRAGLAHDPTHGKGRYYLGQMYAQQGRADLAFPIWRALVIDSAPNAPWIGPIMTQIEDIAYLAGAPEPLMDFVQTARAPGPSADQIEDAANLSREDQAEMVQAMVASLADRLARDGGPAQDWARLIAAYIVLGQTENARIIHAEALQVFALVPDAITVINQAAAPLFEGRE